MARLIPSLILGATFAAATFAVAAETPPAASAPAVSLPAVLAPTAQTSKAATAEPARPRSVSPGVASILAAAMPKYNPEVAKAAAAKAAAEPSQAAETDAPRNGIVRLDPVIVREQRPVIFKPYQIYTKKGFAEYAYQKYITSEVDRALNRFTIPLFGISAQERALQMYREDERLHNISDMSDAARIVSLTDAEGGMYVKRVAEKTFMRTNDFGWNGGASGNSR